MAPLVPFDPFERLLSRNEFPSGTVIKLMPFLSAFMAVISSLSSLALRVGLLVQGRDSLERRLCIIESTERMWNMPRRVGRHDAMIPMDTSSMFQKSEVVISTEYVSLV